MLGISVALGLLAQAAQARNQVQEEPSVCLSIAVHWRGTNEDIRQIASIPVPAGYRRYFDAEWCTRWQLQEEDLVDWHLAFGDEHTTAAALAFLEADYLRDLPSPSLYAPALARAWRNARDDLRRVEQLHAAPSNSSQRATQAIQGSRKIGRLLPLTRGHENYVFLAQQYLRAAEFYESRALFEKARSFYLPAHEAFLLLYGDSRTPSGFATTSTGNDLGLADWRVSEMHDLDMRFAIMQAQLSRNPDDIDAASVVMASNYDPLFRTAIQVNDERRALCDLDEEDRAADDEMRALRIACDEENFFVWRAIDFWRNRAVLDLLLAADPAHYIRLDRPPVETGSDFVRRPDAGPVSDHRESDNVDLAVRLLSKAIDDRPAGAIRENGLEDQLIGLYLLRADSRARVGALLRRADPADADVDQEVSAMDDLWRAAALANPAETPGRFRQIATRFLALHRDVTAHAGETVDGPRRFYAHDRHAAYFRRTLSSLEAIATGR